MALKNHTKKLKELTRGKRVDEKQCVNSSKNWIFQLMKKHVLQQLTPATYIGAAIELVEKL